MPLWPGYCLGAMLAVRISKDYSLSVFLLCPGSLQYPSTCIVWQSFLRLNTRCDDRIWLGTEADVRQESTRSFTSTHMASIHRTHTEIGGSLSACSLAVDMLFYNCRVKPCWAHQSLQLHNQHWVASQIESHSQVPLHVTDIDGSWTFRGLSLHETAWETWYDSVYWRISFWNGLTKCLGNLHNSQ